jgi:hypothetical protein
MVSAVNNLIGRFSGLQRLGAAGLLLLLLLIAAGIYGMVTVSLEEKPYFTPGKAIPNREDCFYDKLAKFKNVNKQIIFQAANECELEIQSLQGHEKMYDAWVQEQAERARQRAAQKAQPKPAEPPNEGDRVRRVWQ